MKVGKMNVKPVWGASGVEGFFGDADRYWYQKLLSVFGIWLLFRFSTFTSKTSTLFGRAGNAKLKDDGFRLKEPFPKCIYITFKTWWYGVVLNAVSLSGPGLFRLLKLGYWQKRKEDFFISLMSTEKSIEARCEEIFQGTQMLLDNFDFENGINIGMQENESCPNVGMSHSNNVGNTFKVLDAIDRADPLRKLTIIVKLAPNITAAETWAISKHRRCDGLCIGNTMPFGEHADEIDYVRYFGSADPNKSPLRKRGFAQPGGLSGKPLLPIICRLIKEARALGVTKHINACGGILGPVSTWKALRAGADSVSIGTGIMLRPWSVCLTFAVAYLVTWYRKNLKGFTKAEWEFPFFPRRQEFKHD